MFQTQVCLKVNPQSFPLTLPHPQFSNNTEGNSILLVTQAKNRAVIRDAYLSLTLHTPLVQKTVSASPSEYIQLSLHFSCLVIFP